MSTTATKRALADALAEAEAFRDSFSPATYERWEIAGSVRRQRPEIGDIEHVVIPKFGMSANTASLFGDPEVNLLFAELDSRVKFGRLFRHVYGATGPRWGDRYRGVDVPWLDGGYTLHEFFVADAANWGSILAIRTGPAAQNPVLMSALLTRGMRHKNGRVWTTRECDCGPLAGSACRLCDGTRMRLVSPVATPDEQTLFELAGMRCFEPRRRG